MRLFITGTGTGVGKTTVAAALVRASIARDLPTVAFKPVESGCEEVDGILQPADAELLWRAQGGHGPVPTWLCRYRYRRPASPEAAARGEEEVVNLERLAEDVATQDGDGLVLIEGAGGLLVPLTHDASCCDLAIRLQARVLVVGSAGLGTINHTLLTVEVARARGLDVAGVVLNGWRTEGDFAFALENAQDIAHHGRVEVLDVLPWASDTRSIDADRVLDALLMSA